MLQIDGAVYTLAEAKDEYAAELECGKTKSHGVTLSEGLKKGTKATTVFERKTKGVSALKEKNAKYQAVKTLRDRKLNNRPKYPI